MQLLKGILQSLKIKFSPCLFQHWSMMDTGQPEPSGRYGHAVVALSSQTLLVSGGDGYKVSENCWTLDLGTRRWNKVGYTNVHYHPSILHN